MSCVPSRRKRITKNHFRIIGNIDLYYKNEILVDFKPLRKKKDVVNCSILPTFTNDRKYYTSAFTVPSEKMESEEQLIEDHEKRVKELCIQIEQIMMPKPRSKSKYCGVCRGHYQDYKEHIQSQKHIINLQQSNYQAHIHKFCNTFQLSVKRHQVEEGKNQEMNTAEENQEKGIQIYTMMTAVKANL